MLVERGSEANAANLDKVSRLTKWSVRCKASKWVLVYYWLLAKKL